VCCRERKARLGVSGFEEVMGMGALAMGRVKKEGDVGGRKKRKKGFVWEGGESHVTTLPDIYSSRVCCEGPSFILAKG
jgi:hypothetical protein